MHSLPRLSCVPCAVAGSRLQELSVSNCLSTVCCSALHGTSPAESRAVHERMQETASVYEVCTWGGCGLPRRLLWRGRRLWRPFAVWPPVEGGSARRRAPLTEPPPLSSAHAQRAHIQTAQQLVHFIPPTDPHICRVSALPSLPRRPSSVSVRPGLTRAAAFASAPLQPTPPPWAVAHPPLQEETRPLPCSWVAVLAAEARGPRQRQPQPSLRQEALAPPRPPLALRDEASGPS